MLYAALIAGVAGLFAFGAVMYRAGRRSAENTQLKGEHKANEQVDKIIRAHGALGRAELLRRLHNNQDK